MVTLAALCPCVIDCRIRTSCGSPPWSSSQLMLDCHTYLCFKLLRKHCVLALTWPINVCGSVGVYVSNLA